MATYQYVDTTGALKTTADQASTPGIAPNSGIQTINAPINSSTIKPTSSIDVPQYNPPQPPSLEAVIAQGDQPSAAETAFKKNDTALTGAIKDIYTHIGGKSARQADLETQAGLPDLNKQLNEINAQIRSYTAQANQAKVNSEDRHAPMFAITGEQAAIDRQLSAKTFGLAAAAQALQGNIALAKDNVQRALDTEFGADQSKLDYQKLLLEKNYDNLTKEEKKRADKTKLQLDERQRLLDAQKQDKKDVFDVLTKAAPNRPPNTVLQAIQNSRNGQEALVAAGPYLAAPFELSAGQTRYDGAGNVIASRPAKGGESSGTTGFKDSKVESEIRQDAVALLADVKANTRTLDEAYSTLRTLYSPTEVSDDAIKALLGVTAPVATAETSAPQSAIEQEIAAIKANPNNILSDGDIKYALSKRYSAKDIANSSVGNVVDQITSFLFR